MNIEVSGWAAFWLFLIVYFLVDTAIFMAGYDSFFYQYKTENELLIQKKKLGIDNIELKRDTAS